MKELVSSYLFCLFTFAFVEFVNSKVHGKVSKVNYMAYVVSNSIIAPIAIIFFNYPVETAIGYVLGTFVGEGIKRYWFDLR